LIKTVVVKSFHIYLSGTHVCDTNHYVRDASPTVFT